MRPTTGTIIGGLLMAALGAAAWWGGTELTAPQAPPECVKIRIDRSDDPAAGYREVMGETVEKEWIRTITICPESGGNIGYDGKGTYFLELEAD